MSGFEPMSLAEYAAFERNLGVRVVEAGGVWWRRVRPFFYRPVFPFQVLDPQTVRPPRSSRWGGFQVPVSDRSRANSYLMYLVCERPWEYRFDALPKPLRQSIRKGLERFEIREITSVSRFIQEAWPVYLSFQARTGYRWRGDRRNREGFARWAEALFANGKVRICGAYNRDGLGGIDSLYRVENVLIGGPTFSRTEALRDRVTDALFHTIRTWAAGCPGVNCLFLGTASSRPSLDEFKLSRGAVAWKVPAYCYVQPLVWRLLTFLYPSVKARLGMSRKGPIVGSDQGVAPAGG